jgi:hypothetical protein
LRWATVVSDSAEAALWEARCLQHFASWLSPSVNRFGPSTSNRFSNHNLFIKHIRYVDNRLIFGDALLKDLAPYEVLLDEGFYGKPIILETEPDQEFLGFMLETQPLELLYNGPTNISQVLSPYSASPPKVLLSGFRSRCHIVVKGAFPEYRGLDQLIQLYILAGFSIEELTHISSRILDLHHVEEKDCFFAAHHASRPHFTVILILVGFLVFSFFVTSFSWFSFNGFWLELAPSILCL